MKSAGKLNLEIIKCSSETCKTTNEEQTVVKLMMIIGLLCSKTEEERI